MCAAAKMGYVPTLRILGEMKSIRLPLKRLKAENGLEDGGGCVPEKIDLKAFVRMFVNQALKEMREALGRFHSISETVCRRELGVFFKQKAADFECLFLLISGVEHLKDANANVHKVRQIRQADAGYVAVADRLAHLFESFKSVIAPKCDVLTALQTAYNPGNLLPRLVGETRGYEVASFDEIDRLSRMYLGKEDLSVYDDVVVDKGIVTLSTKFFSFSLALCGEMSRPEWKLINVKGENEVFSKHLLFGMPHKIDRISRFLRLYETYAKAREMFAMVKRCSEHIDMCVKGYYKRFEVLMHIFRMVVQVEGCSINGKLFIGEDVFPSGGEVVRAFEDKVSEHLRREGRDVSFTFEGGYAVDDGGGVRTFRNFLDMDMFVERRDEDAVFYKFFEERFVCYRNHRSNVFGDKNVFVVKEGAFVCVRLVRTAEGCMDVRVFVGSHEVVEFLSYTEVVLEVRGDGKVCGVIGGKDKRHGSIGTEAIHEYFERSMGLLMKSYKLFPMVSGEIVIGEKILVGYGTEEEITIEEGVDHLLVTTRSGGRMVRPADLHRCIGFILMSMEIVAVSRAWGAMSIVSMDLSKEVSLRLSGLPVALRLGDNMDLEVSPPEMRGVLGCTSGTGVVDLMCTFHTLFAAGIVPTVSMPTGLVFVFKHLFKGFVKVKMIDRGSYSLFLSTEGARDAFRGFGAVIPSKDTVFARRLSGAYFKEKVMMVAEAAKRSCNVIVNEGEATISTSCGHFKVHIDDGKCVFRVCSISIGGIDEGSIQALNEHFSEVIKAGKDVSASMKALSNADELCRLLRSLGEAEESRGHGPMH